MSYQCIIFLDQQSKLSYKWVSCLVLLDNIPI